MRSHPGLLAASGFLALIAVTAGGLEGITDPSMFHDHGWAFYVFGADSILLAIVLARAALQGRTNKALQRQLDAAVAERAELERRLGSIEGIASERGRRIDFLIRSMNVLRERTVILRDCDEDHERRLSHIEERFRLAHDQAVARVALRGVAFDDAMLTPPEDDQTER